MTTEPPDAGCTARMSHLSLRMFKVPLVDGISIVSMGSSEGSYLYKSVTIAKLGTQNPCLIFGLCPQLKLGVVFQVICVLLKSGFFFRHRGSEIREISGGLHMGRRPGVVIKMGLLRQGRGAPSSSGD
ncbi:uncharacterized protein LOC141659173 isoform X2 [Apium graveolens]|uniref:uncharacterized protein LOC141659173 isoform X2 n=1 Tax=Apium graveolens TaxID=4045 RepID=UPI003D79644D